MKSISDCMREAREEKCLTQTELAEKSGVLRQSIVYYEQGRCLPGACNLIALADALNISVDEYIGHVVRK